MVMVLATTRFIAHLGGVRGAQTLCFFEILLPTNNSQTPHIHDRTMPTTLPHNPLSSLVPLSSLPFSPTSTFPSPPPHPPLSSSFYLLLSIFFLPSFPEEGDRKQTESSPTHSKLNDPSGEITQNCPHSLMLIPPLTRPRDHQWDELRRFFRVSRFSLSQSQRA